MHGQQNIKHASNIWWGIPVTDFTKIRSILFTVIKIQTQRTVRQNTIVVHNWYMFRLIFVSYCRDSRRLLEKQACVLWKARVFITAWRICLKNTGSQFSMCFVCYKQKPNSYTPLITQKLLTYWLTYIITYSLTYLLSYLHTYLLSYWLTPWSTVLLN